MLDFLLNLFLVILVLIGLFSTLIVLMQRPSSQPGMGAALGGGGAAEQAFGADSATVLTKATQTTTIIFFVLSFLLYLGFQARYEEKAAEGESLIPQVIEVDSSGAETEVEVVEPGTDGVAPPATEADSAPAGNPEN